MERFLHVEEDVSSSDEPDPKRHTSSDSTTHKIASNLKNVVVLLGRDVRRKGDKVFMPNTIEMAQLKKPERGQFKKRIKFTRTMTEKDVEEELRRHFSIIRDNGR